MSVGLIPQFYDHKAPTTCGCCEHECVADELNPIEDPGLRLCAGDPLPAGQCIKCGSLSYIDEKEARQ